MTGQCIMYVDLLPSLSIYRGVKCFCISPILFFLHYKLYYQNLNLSKMLSLSENDWFQNVFALITPLRPHELHIFEQNLMTMFSTKIKDYPKSFLCFWVHRHLIICIEGSHDEFHKFAYLIYDRIVNISCSFYVLIFKKKKKIHPKIPILDL